MLSFPPVNDTNLLSQVASYSNLLLAFKECSKGKRNGLGYQKFLIGYGEKLCDIRAGLLNGTFNWQGYREFVVKDPKARTIMAAPFSDRIVHHAIHRVIEPLFEHKMADSSFACRKGKGTSGAVLALLKHLSQLQEKRFVIKLDVEHFFDTVPHDLLLQRLFAELQDDSLFELLNKLVKQSCVHFANQGCGIPIGNLTSQLFANWILTPADRFIENCHPNIVHLRYMDDFVLIARNKDEAVECAKAVVEFVSEELKLSIPFQKVMPIAADPVPFLGFLLSHNSHAILARNRRRFQKHVRSLERRGERESRIRQAKNSYESFWGSRSKTSE